MSADKIEPLRLGSVAPDFNADTTHGPLSLHAHLNSSWGILFSHPEDYTPVCTTELGQVARMKEDWEKRNVKVLGLSCNTLENHEGWLKDIEETQGVKVEFPIIADPKREIAALYGMLDHPLHDPHNISPTGLPYTVRSVYILDPSHTIRLILTYPASCGRNFTEILRAVDSLQLTDRSGLATPVGWEMGGECIVPPFVGDAEARERYGEFRKVKDYLRMVPQPEE